MPNRLHEALVYRAHGFHPIPFYPHSKTPAFDEGEIFRYRERVPSVAELRAMFTDPERNVGLITGVGGLVVLDIDGEEGRDSLRRCGEVPPTPMVQTGDGFHAYFRSEQTIPTRTKIKPGLDIISEDWQVLAPSSVHPDGPTYAWQSSHALSDLELAKPPSWLLELVARPATPHTIDSLPSDVDRSSLLSLPPPPLPDCISNLGASNQKSRLLALKGRLLAPSTLDMFGGWPQILENVDVNLACARYVGLLTVDVGKRFPCVLPGHSDARPSARLYWNVKSAQASMTLKYCDNHYESGEFWYSLADVLASRNYGAVVRLKGPETTVWQLRLLIMSGVLLPYPVTARLLPLDAPRHVKQVYTGFLDLLRAKWLHTPGDPTPFTWSFAAAWCGMRSAGYVVSAIKWLLKEGYLQQVGTHRPKHGRKMTLFLPGKL
jgi:hypothetical protein